MISLVLSLNKMIVLQILAFTRAGLFGSVTKLDLLMCFPVCRHSSNVGSISITISSGPDVLFLFILAKSDPNSEFNILDPSIFFVLHVFVFFRCIHSLEYYFFFYHKRSLFPLLFLWFFYTHLYDLLSAFFLSQRTFRWSIQLLPS